MVGDVFRMILGLSFTLFLPGFLLTTVLFPKKDDLEGFARLTLSMGLSIIIVPLIGLVLNYLPWGVRLLPMTLSLTVFNAILFFLSWYRRTKLSEEKRLSLAIKIDFTKWSNEPIKKKVIHTALLIAGLLLIVTTVFILSLPKTGESFTEFYITGEDGVTAGYPEQLQAGEYAVVKAVIVNNEQQKTRYRLEILMDGDIIQTISPIYLENLEKWEEPVAFKAEKPNNSAKVEFLLFRDGQDVKPYRQLRLWVEILP